MQKCRIRGRNVCPAVEEGLPLGKVAAEGAEPSCVELLWQGRTHSWLLESDPDLLKNHSPYPVYQRII